MNQAALHQLLAKKFGTSDTQQLFQLRLATNLTLIKDLFFSSYPAEKYPAAFDRLLDTLPKLFQIRPKALKAVDIDRVQQGDWYQSHKMVGMQLYVEHFNGNLKGLHDKLDYFKDLGINFLHLMPLMTRPKGENDGGYAVNSYDQVDTAYGTNQDLRHLTEELRKRNMFLMLDFVVNHTSNEFPWAKKALKGSKKYQHYYYTYTENTIPNAFEKTLPEVFPETAPGNFTYQPEIEKWVMTVFNSYQWDLNYTNPEVFLEMLTNLVKLVNLGVDVIRFDALAFLWKEIGTISQNLPQAHTIIALFRMCLQVIAPGVIFLAEAIVAPSDIVKYFGEASKRGNECEIAYNASLMALLWNSIATKKTALLYKTLTNTPQKPKAGTWINYIRCHDDIGLGLDDRFIEELGWNPQGHRKFLLDYYCQNLDWSPAKGLLFMYNPKNGDGRITGSAASLLGLEKALELEHAEMTAIAVKKIILLHGIILSFGGIPMLYSGDEIGTLNDYSFLKEPSKKEDSRWVNRPQLDWQVIANLKNKKLPQSQIFHTLKRLIVLRKKHMFFSDDDNTQLHYTGNDHVLVFERLRHNDKGVLVIGNFNEVVEVIDGNWVKKLGYVKNSTYHDLVSNTTVALHSGLLEIEPHQLMWLSKS